MKTLLKEPIHYFIFYKAETSAITEMTLRIKGEENLAQEVKGETKKYHDQLQKIIKAQNDSELSFLKNNQKIYVKEFKEMEDKEMQRTEEYKGHEVLKQLKIKLNTEVVSDNSDSDSEPSTLIFSRGPSSYKKQLLQEVKDEVERQKEHLDSELKMMYGTYIELDGTKYRFEVLQFKDSHILFTLENRRLGIRSDKYWSMNKFQVYYGDAKMDKKGLLQFFEMIKKKARISPLNLLYFEENL